MIPQVEVVACTMSTTTEHFSEEAINNVAFDPDFTGAFIKDMAGNAV